MDQVFSWFDGAKVDCRLNQPKVVWITDGSYTTVFWFEPLCWNKPENNGSEREKLVLSKLKKLGGQGQGLVFRLHSREAMPMIWAPPGGDGLGTAFSFGGTTRSPGVRSVNR